MKEQEDPRFVQALYDPRFHTYKPKQKQKIVDKRFIIKKKEENQEITKNKKQIEQKNIVDKEEYILRNEQSSNKIAIQNFDWTHLRSKELYVIFQSFIKQIYPNVQITEKLIQVQLYLSNFGKERLKQEEQHGPIDILKQATIINNDGEQDLDQNIIRKYEKERLRYYFGVITFNNKFTAQRVYDQFDDWEIEFSGCRLDLRFIPEKTIFPNKIIEECLGLNEEDIQKIPKFLTKSLGHSEIELTWDKTIKNEIEINNDEEESDIDQEKLNLFQQDLLKGENVYDDFKKNKQEELEITFKVDFNEIDKNLEHKPRKTRGDFIRNLKHKKINKNKRQIQKQQLGLLVDQKKDEFKVNFKDNRFNNLYDNSNYHIDPTNPKYKKNINQKFINEKRTRKNNQLIKYNQNYLFLKNFYNAKNNFPESFEFDLLFQQISVLSSSVKNLYFV